jgi:hypothetical protein
MATLDKEFETYSRLLPDLLGQSGKYVLIKGAEQAGTFDTYQDALSAGYEKFRLEPFLVKQISPAEQVWFFTRDLKACPS